MARVSPISGFPEFLPQQRIVEQQVVDTLRHVFELHGFTPIQTRAIEPVDELARKGEITKEVYTVRRIHASGDEPDEWGLHYDLTVPFARYVVENAGKLNFPLRRYQIQPCWRGERPQEGRYREFWQADIDVVGQNTLATHHEAEVVLVMLEAWERLHSEIGLPVALTQASNRKLLQGFYAGIGVADPLAAIQVVDKLGKIGEAGGGEILTAQGLSASQVGAILSLATIHSDGVGFVDQVRSLGVTNSLVEEGLDELATLVSAGQSRFPGRIVADLRIARGLDYYTGCVFETVLPDYPALPSVSGGGRYDALAVDGVTTYPGVGISLGITRLLAPLLAKDKVKASRSVPSAVLVAVDDEPARGDAESVATHLRARDISCEVAPKADKYGKQIRYADRRGIPYVWFGGVEGEVKDIRTGEQVAVDARTWTPPQEDLTPAIVWA